MYRFFVGLVLVAFALGVGSSCGGGGSAESAAKGFLEALKNADADAFVSHIDLKSAYDSMSDEQRKAAGFKSYDDLVKQTRQKFEDLFKEKQADLKKGEYTVEGSEVKDDATVVKAKIRKSKDADWTDVELRFKKVDGKWKMPIEDVVKLAG